MSKDIEYEKAMAKVSLIGCGICLIFIILGVVLILCHVIFWGIVAIVFGLLLGAGMGDAMPHKCPKCKKDRYMHRGLEKIGQEQCFRHTSAGKDWGIREIYDDVYECENCGYVYRKRVTKEKY